MTGFPLALPLDCTAPRYFEIINRSEFDTSASALYRVEIELLNTSELTAMRNFVAAMRSVPAQFRSRRVPA